MFLSREQVRILRNSILYTILKNADKIDFSRLDSLTQRYLLKNIITLNEFYSEKSKK